MEILYKKQNLLVWFITISILTCLVSDSYCFSFYDWFFAKDKKASEILLDVVNKEDGVTEDKSKEVTTKLGSLVKKSNTNFNKNNFVNYANKTNSKIESISNEIDIIITLFEKIQKNNEEILMETKKTRKIIEEIMEIEKTSAENLRVITFVAFFSTVFHLTTYIDALFYYNYRVH